MFKVDSTIKPMDGVAEPEDGFTLHPFCSVFPEMNEEEYDSLVASMQNQGYLATDPIILYYPDSEEFTEPQILDGRNRHSAASDAGVKPVYVEYIGSDPRGFVLSRNMDRRHLSSGQKAAIASKIATMGVGQNQHSDEESISRDEAAKTLQTTTKAIQRYRFVEKHNPKLADEVADGVVTLGEAEKIVKRSIQDEKMQRESNRIEAEGEMDDDIARMAEYDSGSNTRPVTGHETGPGTHVPPDVVEDEEKTNDGTDDTAEYQSDPVRDLVNHIVGKYMDRQITVPVMNEMVEMAVLAGRGLNK